MVRPESYGTVNIKDNLSPITAKLKNNYATIQNQPKQQQTREITSNEVVEGSQGHLHWMVFSWCTGRTPNEWNH